MSKVSPTEKAFTVAGLVLIAAGCIANLYGAYINQRFIHDPLLDTAYYFLYAVLLVGGFIAGYIFTRKESSKLFGGVFYAVFAATLYFALDILRLLTRWLVGTLPFPGEKILFEGMPLFAVIVTFIIAYFAQKSKKQLLSPVSKKIFIVVFAAYELYSLGVSLYYSNSKTPLWLAFTGYFITPLAIAIVSYFLLGGKKTFERLFYAIFIGALYGTLLRVMWEFQANIPYDATMLIIFSVVATIVSLVLTGLLIWRVRQLKMK